MKIDVSEPHYNCFRMEKSLQEKLA